MNKPKVDLDGEDGNAFFILARVRKAGKKVGWTDEDIDTFTKKATSGDYDHLLRTVMEYCEVD